MIAQCGPWRIFVSDWSQRALTLRWERKKRTTSPTLCKLDGVGGKANLITIWLGKPPAGYGRSSLQLLADELTVLEVVPSICAETARKTLKKRHGQAQD
jgi:hypothetical protein